MSKYVSEFLECRKENYNLGYNRNVDDDKL